MTRTRVAIFFLAALPLGAWCACNVWGSLENCSADGDCPSHETCDTTAGLCIAADASSIDSGPDRTTVDSGTAFEAGDADAAPPCDLTAQFGQIALVAGLEGQEIFSARLTADGLTLYYAAYNGPANLTDLMQATRTDAGLPFVSAGPMNAVNSSADEFWPTVSADGETLFFESERYLTPMPDAASQDDQSRIWATTRNGLDVDFDPPRIEGIFLDAGAMDTAPYLHPSKTSLYFGSLGRGGAGDTDIFVATIQSGGVFTSIDDVTPVNSAVEENFPVVSADDRSLYFSRPDVSDDESARHVMVSTRATPSDAWGAPTEVTELSTPFDEFPSFITADACSFYFISNRPTPSDPPDSGPGMYHAWIAVRPP